MSKVLLIGDGHEVMQFVGRVLAANACTVEFAAGDADALRRLRRQSFDVIVTSPETSVEEDLALLEEMRAIRPGVKTIILAPDTAPEDVIAALRARVFLCLSAPFDAQALAGHILRALADTDWRSDIEVLSAHRNWISLRVNCRLLTADRVVTFLDEMGTDVPADEREPVMLAFREILMNAMEHGAGFDPEKVVEVAAVRTERATVFYVRDPGPGFRPDAVPHAAVSNPPDDPMAHLELREEQGMRPGGYGILLAKRVVDEMFYSEVGNEVLLIKHLA